MNKPYLIIDGHSLGWRARYGMRETDLSYEGKETEVIFSFLFSVRKLAKDFETNKIVFVWDSEVNYRKLFYHSYKENRSRNKTEIDREFDRLTHQQLTTLRRFVITRLGLTNNFSVNGLEGDDLIALVISKNPQHNFIIVSSDSDLYQLLSPRVSVWNYKRIITKEIFKKAYGIETTDWIMVKALAGCKSDNVAGIEGIGEHTAIKYIRGELKKETKSHQLLQTPAAQAVIRRNIRLVRLPLDYPIETNFTLQKDSLWLKNFTDVFIEYGFKSFLHYEEMAKWMEVMELQ